MKKRSWKLYLSPNPRLVRKCNNSTNNLYYLPCSDYLITLKFITNDILHLCPFSRWWWSGASWSVQCGWIDLANVIYVMVALTLLLLCLPLFLKLRRGFSFIYHFIYPYHYLILSHYIISSWSAKNVKSQIIATCATHSYSLASPEECKLMRAFAQVNLSQFADRSRGERSRLQQGNDRQVNYLFFSYFNYFS